ncbi:gamma-butyrobetaine dioxygenase [Aureococcus anophagefferens]|uniref:Gamma-butyrobetaine dioxygenase n=1 Tax=Aureococcus anophagefferens TaxID=44056 RepID=A0ABR1G2V6_AURAN
MFRDVDRKLSSPTHVVPDEESGVFVRRFADDFLGGMQKEPTRDERNWRIVRREHAASISYDPAKRLYQHTDSSVPPHGIPALMLTMHYVEGYGANTLTDGFAVARDLRAADPEAFELLATHGVDAERDFAGSRADSVQAHKQGLVIKRKHPLFVLDDDGELARVQYNEVFRTALSLPYDVFPRYYAAFSTFVEMLHNPKYERTVDMAEGNLLVMNNWRTLHGRAGGRASPNRHIVGGTVLREAIFSKAMGLAAAD